MPVKDITAIYKRMGYYVPGPVLSHCMRNGFAGAQANARLGSQLFPVYASKVTWTWSTYTLCLAGLY